MNNEYKTAFDMLMDTKSDNGELDELRELVTKMEGIQVELNKACDDLSDVRKKADADALQSKVNRIEKELQSLRASVASYE